MRSLVLTVAVLGIVALGTVLVGCGDTSSEPPSPPPPFKAIAEGPKTNNLKTVGWYLQQIQELIDKANSGATALHKQLVYEGIAALSNSHHAHHNPDRSWVRVQSAYWHAVSKNWYGVASKLGTDTEIASATWWDFKPAKTPDGWNMSLTQLLDALVPALNGGGHFAGAAGATRKTLVGNAVAYRKQYGFNGHSAEATWVHAYLAYQYAQVPKSSDNNSKSVVFTICELLHDV